MDEASRAAYETRAKELRASLKQWEIEWANAHDGQKPGRHDIKANPAIASRYKEYNKTRDTIAGKLPPTVKQAPKTQQRESESVSAATPKKNNDYTQTPSKTRDGNQDLMSPAISRKLFSPTSVTSLGPTPQRDGRVLGLFDLLVEKELATPSRNTNTPSKSKLKATIHTTPSKRKASFGDESAAKLGRTPMSSSKRQMLNTFMTPLKLREQKKIGTRTPSSVSKLRFDTPAFLKRHSLPAVTEAAEFEAPVAPLRLPRKPLVRGLSEIVASLRKVEEEQLDDDLAALRDVENEQMGVKAPLPTSTILARDSQANRLPLGGFDDEGAYDSPDEQQLGRGGLPLPIYKKKGQKRTTRLVKMKPTGTKRPATVADSVDEREDVNERDDENEGDMVPETQLVAGASQRRGSIDLGHMDHDSHTEPASKPTEITNGNAVRKTVRKVNELAHANFKRLKLRNHGTKGGPGYKSRFRRKR